MEFAPAKINLALHLTGQREDGYHLLDSLVVFADVGDELAVATSDQLSLAIDGPERAGLTSDADNLVLKAARYLNNARGAALTLTKNLPVASGIGGGSADAAAALRLLSRHWGVPLPADVLALGADVPVCLSSKPARMRGIGEVIEAVPHLPDMALLLVNPREPVSTPAIFKAIKNKNNSPMDAVPKGAGFDKFCVWLSLQRNDMQSAAITEAPVIELVLKAIENSGATLARMSGSGATCFGLFQDITAAQEAANKLRAEYPEWWVKSARVLT
ncbi:4-(cytidine 5'-diphospho)-2-C-methyl-D-erythritol kinase [Falsihalocynthiibacter sp. SS001]|uniref:4-(cytidine 5'-diphospho)-2-C-methyl-D-erythritol kinase n=1 Tax=Falsihalocynthiibacter sp. SS001 TaxID=3349698 RepID=UPI0036D2BF50